MDVAPESGTTTYSYNSDKTLHHKQDANGKYTGYTYDAYKRPVRVDRGTWGTNNFITIQVSPEGGSPGSLASGSVTLNGNSMGNWSSGWGETANYLYATTDTLASKTLHVQFASLYSYLLKIYVNGVDMTPSPGGYSGNYTYDITFSSGYSDATGVQGDVCQAEEYSYGTASTDAGRMTTVKYRGGNKPGYSPSCDTTFTETYAYSAAGAVTSKAVNVNRSGFTDLTLTSTYTYDTEGRNTGIQYPSSWNGYSDVTGPNRTISYDNLGRLNKLTDASTSTDIISAATYNEAGQMLTMTGAGGAPSETRVYNSIGQMKELTVGSLHMQYAYPTNNTNNGKILSETNAVSGETVTYTYDSLNRLATATSSDTPGWGQSFTYDGFGNLSNVSTTKGSAPNLTKTYNASNNRRTDDCADSNGNLNPQWGKLGASPTTCGGTNTYDIANRIASA